MAAVKPKRHGPAMDMTAMCDVAFLLLTFFIMTTQFKSQETVKIMTPTSTNPEIVADINIGTISVSTDGKYYFGVTDSKERVAFIQTLNSKLNLNLTNSEILKFSKIAEVGVGKDKIKQYLSLSEDQMANVKVDGLSCDSSKTELVDWVKAYGASNPKGTLAIRGDVKTQYPAIKSLFKELGDAGINKFKLITKGEGK
jgi:biopolymer transport protein ExbD